MGIYYVSGIPFGDELYHHGIKGQKWGVRRFQNPDGSLTAEGRKRLEEYVPKEKELDKYYKDLHKAYDSSSELKTLKQKEEKNRKALSDYKDKKRYSLRDFIPDAFDKQLKEYSKRTTDSFMEWNTLKMRIKNQMEDQWASKTLKSIGMNDTKEAREFLINRGWTWI